LKKEKCSIVGLFDNGDMAFQNEFNDAAELNPNFAFIKVNAEDFPELFQKNKIYTTPAILTYFEGEPITTTVGADTEALKLMIDELKDEATRRTQLLPKFRLGGKAKQRECVARDPALRAQWETSPREVSNVEKPLARNKNQSESNAASTGILKIASTLTTGFSAALSEQAETCKEIRETVTETYALPPKRRSRRSRENSQAAVQ